MKRQIAIILCIILILELSACGFTQEDLNEARKAGYSSGYEDGYEDGYAKGREDGYDEGYTALKPVNEPSSGTILSGKQYDESSITIRANSENSYVVKLKNAAGAERLSFYVRAGSTVTVGVPATFLYVYFASGETWYGEENLFGDDTFYSKDDELLDFEQYTWEYTLYPVTDGNFSETPIDASEFK